MLNWGQGTFKMFCCLIWMFLKKQLTTFNVQITGVVEMNSSAILCIAEVIAP